MTAAPTPEPTPELLEALRWALDQIEDDLDPDHATALAAAHVLLARVTEGPTQP